MGWLVVIALLAAGCGRLEFAALSDADRDGGPRDGPTDGTDTPDTSAACVAIPDLLAHYPMTATTVAGGVLRDVSGNGYDATLVGLFGGSSDPLAGLVFDPVGTSYVELPDLPIPLVSGTALTFTLRFLRADVSTVSEDLVNAPQEPARYSLWMVEDKLCVNTASSECWGVTDTTMSSRWVHAAVILRSGPEMNSEIFIDGVAQTLVCTMATCSVMRTVDNPVRFGASDIYAFHGQMADARVYARALTPAEIAAIADGDVCP